MNESTEKNSDGNGNMDEVGQVINLAGAREPVPDERFVRSRQKVHQHWQQVVDKQRTEKPLFRFRTFAIAASIALGVGATLTLWNSFNDPRIEFLASVERVLGEVLLAGDVASKGGDISAGTSIVTDSNSRIALRMSGGQSLRVDSASRVIVHSPNHVSLEAGAVYIDTAFAAKEDPVLVSTPLGTAQDIGTQFQVRLTGQMLVVGVRQGLVEVVQPGQQGLSINKGHYVELSAGGQSSERPLDPDDPDWNWIDTVTPGFDIQGVSLEKYLQWYAGESGLDLVWADEASELNARAALLSGSITGLSLDESLVRVQQVAPFEYRVSNEGIWVKVE